MSRNTHRKNVSLLIADTVFSDDEGMTKKAMNKIKSIQNYTFIARYTS